MSSVSTNSPLRLSNQAARRLFLERHGLADDPSRRLSKADLQMLIERLGFVQVDSINTVARAHDMILFSRRQCYRPKQLKALLEKERSLFEHWTHDASIIPACYYPYWQMRFSRSQERLKQRWREWRRQGFEEKFDEILAHIRQHGPAMSRDMGEGEKKNNGGWWDWHPSKTALEYLWRTGQLAVCGREGFQKVYDLSERVIAEEHRAHLPGEAATIDWACSGALDRLGFATSGEMASFWDGVTSAEAKSWCAEKLGNELIEVEIETADGKVHRVLARPDVGEQAEAAVEAPARIRALSPFDPAIRDRKRTERLFGFNYRIEVFVPAPKRTYGYYVFPLLEGDRLIGRIDMKCRRDAGILDVSALWLEPKVRPGRGRLQRLEAELDRVRRFIGCERVVFADGWVRESV
ncbi:MAG: winged helix-turn-helix domain-containing protein [Hyphomicrobiales bacterium]|nr:winged helix-turn-helix domain-containing protein [Hyphomicrobiales bacterium]MCP4997818.1 winged helix-turn-helix domain-containing protein [Hyphomicrobiales bacterium]